MNDEIAVLLSLLRESEWSGVAWGDGEAMCPWCHGLRDLDLPKTDTHEAEPRGHKKDCRLMAVEDIFTRPDRAHRLTVHLGGDTLYDVISALEDLTWRFRHEGLTTSVCGSASFGYVVAYKYDPTMTHDRYMTELNAYLMKKDGRTN